MSAMYIQGGWREEGLVVGSTKRAQPDHLLLM